MNTHSFKIHSFWRSLFFALWLFGPLRVAHAQTATPTPTPTVYPLVSADGGIFYDEGDANIDSVKNDAMSQTTAPSHPSYKSPTVETRVYDGFFSPARDGAKLAVLSDDGTSVSIDGQQVLDRAGQGQGFEDFDSTFYPLSTSAPLQAGQIYHLHLVYTNTIHRDDDDMDGITLFAYDGGGSIVDPPVKVKITQSDATPNPAELKQEVTINLNAQLKNPHGVEFASAPSWDWALENVQWRADDTEKWTNVALDDDSYAVDVEWDPTTPQATWKSTFYNGGQWSVRAKVTVQYTTIDGQSHTLTAHSYVGSVDPEGNDSDNSGASAEDASTQAFRTSTQEVSDDEDDASSSPSVAAQTAEVAGKQSVQAAAAQRGKNRKHKKKRRRRHIAVDIKRSDGIDASLKTTRYIRDIKKNGKIFVGRYLSSRPKGIRMKEAQALSKRGLYIVSIWESSPVIPKGVSFPSPAYDALIKKALEGKGKSDAKRAATWAKKLGQPSSAPIYFCVDFEVKKKLEKNLVVPYFRSVNKALKGSYPVGVYSQGSICQTLLDKKLSTYSMLSASTGFPGSPEFEASNKWQIDQLVVDRLLPGSSIKVDFDKKRGNYGGWKVSTSKR